MVGKVGKTNILLFVFCLLPLCGLFSQKLSVKVEKAGTLSELIDYTKKYSTTSLEIEGELDSKDFIFLREMLGWSYNDAPTSGVLTEIDMKNAIIKDCSDYCTPGNTLSADCLPYGIFKNTKLTSIILPQNLKQIEGMAFTGCTELKSITIPAGVTAIWQYAFAGCSSLESFYYPDGCTYVGQQIFVECTSLKSVRLSPATKRIYSSAFYKCESLEEIYIPGSVELIDQWAFGNCSKLTTATLDEGVAKIGDNAFNNCENLKKITLPSNTLKSIGGSAFNNSALETVNIPNSVTSVGYNMFGGCKALKSVHFGEGINELPSNTFFDTGLLERVTFAGKITKIGESAFAHSGISQLSLPESVEEIGNNAFFNCLNLKSIKMPASLKKIGNSAFYYCENLEEVTFNDNLCSIEAAAFFNCGKIKKIELPGSIKTLGKGVFKMCKSLSSANMADINMDSIPAYLFDDCSMLSTILYPKGLKYIGTEAFDGTTLDEIEIPDGVTYVDRNAYSIKDKKIDKIILPGSLTCLGKSAIGISTSDNVVIRYKSLYLSSFNLELGSFPFGYPDEIHVTTAAVPKILHADNFILGGDYRSTILYVPTGTRQAFAADAFWGNFENIIEEDVTSIKEIINTDDGVSYYSLDGRLLPEARKGIILMRKANKVQKIVVD